jgi:hypothetical protein
MYIIITAITAINSTEGTDEKFLFWAVFDSLERIVWILVNSARIGLKDS